MIMDKWVEKNLGKSIDYDGVYGVQCVDLIKHFVKMFCLSSRSQSAMQSSITASEKPRLISKLILNGFQIPQNLYRKKATFAFSPRKAETVIFLSPPEREQPLISIRMTKIIPRASMNL